MEIAENTEEHLETGREGLRVEEQLSGKDDDPGLEDPQSLEPGGIGIDPQLLVSLFLERLQRDAQKQNDKIVHAVEQVLPSGSVPDAGRDPDREKRHGGGSYHGPVFAIFLSGLLAPVLDHRRDGHGIEHIVFKPVAQAHVPAAPEFSRALRRERLVEVLRDRHAEDLAASDDDIDTAGEFHIQLDRIRDRGHDDKTAVVVLVIAKNLIGQKRESVRDHHLLGKTPENTQKSFVDIGHMNRLAAEKRFSCIRKSRDRAFHDLREKAQKQSHFAQMLLGRVALPVYIRHVSDGFQGIERNSHGEQHSGHRKLSAERTKENIHVLRHEIVVIDVEQNTKQNKDSQPEYFYSLFLKVLLNLAFLFAVSAFLLLLRALRPEIVHPEGDLPGECRRRHKKQHKESAE